MWPMPDTICPMNFFPARLYSLSSVSIHFSQIGVASDSVVYLQPADHSVVSKRGSILSVSPIVEGERDARHDLLFHHTLLLFSWAIWGFFLCEPDLWSGDGATRQNPAIASTRADEAFTSAYAIPMSYP